MHHENILLDDKKGWMLIDPLGVVGDPVYSVGQYFHNPMNVLECSDAVAKMKKRVDIFSEIFQCERSRVSGWGFVACAIACFWTWEDGDDDFSQELRCTEILRDLYLEDVEKEKAGK